MHIENFLNRNAKLFSRKVALICDGQRLTYAELRSQALGLGRALLSLGLNKGDRVALLDFNSLAYAIFHVGVPAVGLIAVPLNFRLAARELKAIINDASCRVLIYSSPYIPVVEEIRGDLPSVEHFVCLTRPRGEDIGYGELLSNVHAEPLARPHEDDPAYILYTSGTTGLPKGAVHSYGNTLMAIRGWIIEQQIIPENRVLHVAPFFHVAGAQPLLAFLYRGCTGIILPQFDPEKVMETIQRERITNVLMVPSMINVLLNHPKLARYDLSSLCALTYAGAPMPNELLRKGLATWGPIFFQIYGLTETSVVTVLNNSEHVVLDEHGEYRYLSSCGREIIDVRLRVVNEMGEDVFPGEVGEVVVKGDNIMKEYWQKDEETREVIKRGWFYTGDMGTLDEDGYLFLLDRKKDVIISGGENIYPAEIENVLYMMPEIAEAAVIGVPDEKWGETVKAVVVLKEGQTLSEHEIVSFCKKNLASYKKPTSVAFVQEIPRNPAGKALKKLMRERYYKIED